MDHELNSEYQPDFLSQFLTEYYNIHSFYSTKLPSYEDENILIVIDKHDSRNCVRENCILKVSRQVGEQYMLSLDLQMEMIQYLAENGITTTTPVPTVNGELKCQYTINTKSRDVASEATIHMLRFVPGITLRKAGNAHSLMESVGALAGKVDKLLTDFKPTVMPQLDNTWGTPDISSIRDRLSEHCDTAVTAMGLGICQQYELSVLPVLHKFQKGYIHGDFNDCNIIVQPTQTVVTDTELNYHVSGLIDFGDIMESYYVFEVAFLMADLMSASLDQENPIFVAHLLLRGYRKEMHLSNLELTALRLCICVRLLQYYILTGDTLKSQPNNPYLQTCLDRDKYLKIFLLMYKTSESKFKSDIIN